MTLAGEPVLRNRSSLWAERSKCIRKVGRRRYHPKSARPTSRVGSPLGADGGLWQDVLRAGLDCQEDVGRK